MSLWRTWVWKRASNSVSITFCLLVVFPPSRNDERLMTEYCQVKENLDVDVVDQWRVSEVLVQCLESCCPQTVSRACPHIQNRLLLLVVMPRVPTGPAQFSQWLRRKASWAQPAVAMSYKSRTSESNLDQVHCHSPVFLVVLTVNCSRLFSIQNTRSGYPNHHTASSAGYTTAWCLRPQTLIYPSARMLHFWKW